MGRWTFAILRSGSNRMWDRLGGRRNVRILETWQGHPQSDCTPISACDEGSLFLVSSPALLGPPSHPSRILVAPRVPVDPDAHCPSLLVGTTCLDPKRGGAPGLRASADRTQTTETRFPNG